MDEFILKFATGLTIVLMLVALSITGFAGYKIYYDYKHDCHCVRSHFGTCWMYQPALKMSMPHSCTVCDQEECKK